MSMGGLTQHLQATHYAARRHTQRSPTHDMEPVGCEQSPFDNGMQVGHDYKGIRQQQVLQGRVFTIFHPLIDSSYSFIKLGL
jgi:hypothetical protein